MPLRDVLRISEKNSGPITEGLAEQIAQIMAEGQPDTDISYSVDEVLTYVVYALRDAEQKIVELEEYVRILQLRP